MSVHRRQLPIASPCEGFQPAPGSAEGLGGYCQRCRKTVHDVSAMRESELRRFIAARVGQTVCVAYRVDAHGGIVLRPEPRPARAALAAMTVLLVACAGHVTELEVPGTGCVDASGYEVACSDPEAIDLMSVPDGVASASTSTPVPSSGCPIRPSGGPVGELELVDSDPLGLFAEPSEDTVEPLMPSSGGASAEDAEGTAAKIRVNFDIDPDRPSLMLGMVVGGTIERDFVPTRQLLDEARERRQERRVRRRRARERRAASASR